MIFEKYAKELKIFEEQIHKSENIVIVPHYNPDGDAIGSALAVYHILSKLNKKVSIISPTLYPGFLKWLPANNKIRVLGKKTESDPNIFDGADMIIGVDFNALSRINNIRSQFSKSKAFKVLIDHHPNPENFIDLLFTDTVYSSTAELVYEIIESTFLINHFDKDCATCIYTGIMTDTGSFNFNSSNPNTFRVVGELMKQGVEKDKIFNQVYDSFSADRMRFLGHVLLNRMVILPELKTGYIYVSAADRKEFNEQFGDTENFVNLPLSIKGIIFSAIFIERDNFIKISFRSKGSFSVNDFSMNHFHGGGHINAAGGESFDSLQETIKNFVSILQDYESELKNYSY
jgi:phosphoesterase RecJ-like protein